MTRLGARASVTPGDYRGAVEIIGVAGGIGAGKSTVTDYLERRGFPVIDADDVAHHVVEPNRPAWRALRDAFGDAVLAPDGHIDRAFLAEVVFHDPTALERLNRITHGQIGAEIRGQLDQAAGPAVFVALPLFRPEHRAIFSMTRVWGVLASFEVALARLVGSRGLDERDARARLEVQPSNDERLADVDDAIWNEGTKAELYERVDELLAARGLA